MDKTKLKKEKILLIESDAVFGGDLLNEFKKNGYNVSLCNNGVDGLNGIVDMVPDLIILDTTLSDMSGYTLLSNKQQQQNLSSIPVFLVNTQGTPIDMKKIPEGSVKDVFVSLHISPSELVSKINTYLKYPEEVLSTNNINKKKILWVEDDKLIGSILSKKLINSGFDLLHAKNGEEALDFLEKTTPDAVIVDLLLPGMSGFDILQKMLMNERTKKIPSMVLSNLSKQSDIDKAKMLGAKKFLVKATYSLDQIVAEIREL
jgi:DNA-binding response OmpR family regulator